MKVIVLLSLLLTLGCHDHAHEGAHGEQGHDDHAEESGHGHDEETMAHQVTRWGPKTQLFVEFPVLVKGEESAFAVHLTGLEDHQPVAQGKVTVILTAGDASPEQFDIEKPSVPGIFRPVVIPKEVAKRQVVVRLETEEGPQAFDLGYFQVWKTRAEAKKNFHEHPPEGISFTLENQWKMEFSSVAASERELRPSLEAFAKLTLPSDAEAVITAPRSGRVGAPGDYPMVGQSAEVGEQLFVLSVGPQEDADFAGLEFALEAARIRVSSADREVKRLGPLVEQGIVPQKRLDDAMSTLAEARAALQSAQRRQGNIGGSQRVSGGRDGLRIPSPLSGQVAELFVANGEWVQSGQPIARIVNSRRLWLDAAIPQVYLGKVRNIQGVWFELRGYSDVFELDASSLMSVAAEVDPQSRTLPARFRVENPDGRLFAGMTTNSRVIVDAPVAQLAVPKSALVFDAGMDVVFVQIAGEVFERRPVVKGIEDGDWVAITRGLEEGERVVALGAHTIKLASISSDEIGHGHAH